MGRGIKSEGHAAMKPNRREAALLIIDMQNNLTLARAFGPVCRHTVRG